MEATLTVSQPIVLSPSQPVHFIGIGGIGMSGLAKLLLEAGVPVSGSDAKANANTWQLADLGAQIYIGHQAQNIPAHALVALSTAIQPDNPEFQEAQRLGLTMVHRSDILAAVMHGELFQHTKTVGITGTHGKTTITGMIGLALQTAGFHPTIVAGGLLPGVGSNAVLGQLQPNGKRSVAVAELDESDQSLSRYRPTHSIISNIELDHADHYPGGLEEILEVFQAWLYALPENAGVILNADCPNTRRLLPFWPDHVQPVWISDSDNPLPNPANDDCTAYYTLQNVQTTANGCYQATVLWNGSPVTTLALNVPGRFNLFNALAAVAMADQLGADLEKVRGSLNGFSGMGRRFETVGQVNGALLVDDYGHHPTEIEATLRGTRALCDAQGTGRVMVVFQPHRYSRLKTLWRDFTQAFGDADQVWITDVYGAGEAPTEGPSAQDLANGMIHPCVHSLAKTDWAAFKASLPEFLKPGDILLSMGAGDITQIFRV